MYAFTRTQALVLNSTITFVLLSSSLAAGPVRLEQAQRVTDAFLRTRNVRAQIGSNQLLTVPKDQGAEKRVTFAGFRQIRGDDGSLLAYIADLEPRGFVATSADTGITPIVAYSFRTPFPTSRDSNNPLYLLLKEDMRLRKKALAQRLESGGAASEDRWNLYAGGEPGAEVFQQWPQEGATSTGGWLETAWSQDAPYNDLCPLDPADSETSYVGCVATALAQVVNLHKLCDAHFDADDSYTTFSGMSFDADSELYDFPSFEELNGYLAEVRHKYESQMDLTDADIAALSFASGIATQMDYSSRGSGASAYRLPGALRDKFGFHSAEITGGLSGEYYHVLQDNMINGLPALLSIGPSDSWGGHVIVCDGYNTDGEYHLNFGWGSPHPEEITEVWYRLPSDLMSDLSIVTEAVLDICPVRPDIKVDKQFLSFYASPEQESVLDTLHIENTVEGVWINAISCPPGFVMARWGEPYSDYVNSFQLQEPGSRTTIYVKFCPQEEQGYYGTLDIDYSNGKRKRVILKGYSYVGGTEIPAGDVSGTWSQAESPYLISGDIEIPDNSELVIEPGVRVVFMGPHGMTVGQNATLTAEGSAGSPIVFTALNKDVGWRGLRFLDSGGDDTLSYCSLTFSKKNAGLGDDENVGRANDYFGSEQYYCGGAIYCLYSDVFISNCIISNNAGDNAGAIYCEASNPRISNVVIANNVSQGGEIQCGGISTDMWSEPVIKNCTIVNNSPGGIFARSSSGLHITNTILWGNERYQILTEECTPTVSFCDIEQGYEGQGNIDADPCFFDPTGGIGLDFDATSANWALRSCSPCINSGAETLLPPTDLAGASRVNSNIVDIGAYENQSELPLITIAPSPTVDAGFVLMDTSAIVSLEITNSGTAEFTVESLSIDDSEGVFSIGEDIENRPLAPGDSLPVGIRFSPTAERKYTGTLHVHSTCSNAPDKQIALQAVGVDGTIVSPANRGTGMTSGTWAKADSPYVITSDVDIPRGQSLYIEPGVTVKFAGHFKITIGYLATLRAIGTEAENIVFAAIDPNEGWFGMRFVNSGTDDMLEHCTIEYSKKPRSGGGGYENLMGGAILCAGSWDVEPGYLIPSSPTIKNCLIAHNRAMFGGAIMCADDSEAEITNNRIVDNKADLGGAGMYIAYGSPVVSNNIIAHNSAGVVGGGIMSWISTPSIKNNTIVRNRPSALHLETTTLYPWWPTPPVPVQNNIIWQNEIHVTEEVLSSEYDITFNDVQGGWNGEGNIDADPFFADAENRDYHLMSHAGCWDQAGNSWIASDLTSPCIDAGDPAAPVGNEPAPHGDRINMGAYGSTEQASKSF